MASAKEFSRLARIKGVADYLLVRADGQVVAQQQTDSMENGAPPALLVAPPAPKAMVWLPLWAGIVTSIAVSNENSAMTC